MMLLSYKRLLVLHRCKVGISRSKNGEDSVGARVVGCDPKVPEPRNSQNIKKLTTMVELSFSFQAEVE